MDFQSNSRVQPCELENTTNIFSNGTMIPTVWENISTSVSAIEADIWYRRSLDDGTQSFLCNEVNTSSVQPCSTPTHSTVSAIGTNSGRDNQNTASTSEVDESREIARIQQSSVFIAEASRADNNNTVQDAINDLHAYLQSIVDGKSILFLYEKEGILPPRYRSLLVRIIVAREKERAFEHLQCGEKLPHFEITSDQFQNLARQICEVFPNEKHGTYYNPYKKIGNTKICASGKLYDHFNYIKSKLHETGQLIKKKKTLNNSISTPKQVELTETQEQTIEWLKHQISPWNHVVDAWKATFAIRRSLLLQNDISVADYLNRFKCLQDPKAYTLFQEDFAELHPGKEHCLLLKWASLKSKLLAILQSTRKPTSTEKQVQVNELLTLPSERQDASILYLLTTLIQTPYVTSSPVETSGTRGAKKRAMRKRKVSTLEAQEAFFLVVPNASNLKLMVDRKKEEARQRKETFQPFPVLIGTLTNVEDAYVILEDQQYRVQTALNAIDLVFKIYYALDCEYPSAARQIWIFFQEGIYSIKNESADTNVSVRMLIGEVTDT